MTIQDMHYNFRVKLDRLDNEYYANITADEVDLILNEALMQFVTTRIRPSNPRRESFEETQKRQDDIKELISADTILTKSIIQTGVKPNGIFFDLPSDYFYAIQEEAEIAYNNCNENPVTERRGFVGIPHSNYLYIKDNPFKIPTIDDNFGVRLMSDNKIEALTFGNYDINFYYMRYVKMPRKMQFTDDTPVLSGNLSVGTRYKVLSGSIQHAGSTLNAGDTFTALTNIFIGTGVVVLDGVDCELNEESQREIINIAVNIALDIIESPRAQQYQTKIIEQE